MISFNGFLFDTFTVYFLSLVKLEKTKCMSYSLSDIFNF